MLQGIAPRLDYNKTCYQINFPFRCEDKPPQWPPIWQACVDWYYSKCLAQKSFSYRGTGTAQNKTWYGTDFSTINYDTLTGPSNPLTLWTVCGSWACLNIAPMTFLLGG